MLNWAAIRLRTMARKAARGGDWAAAAKAYRAYLDRRPRDVAGWVQYGHATKELGDFDIAITAYECALTIDPAMPETWWHLCHLRKRLGDRAGAIDCCIRALAIDPEFTPAIDELAALGARDSIPLALSGDVAGALRGTPVAAGRSPGPAIYQPAQYDAFRRDMAIPAPPREVSEESVPRPITILIDARGALPAEVRATLSSLLDQVDDRWVAIVHASQAIRDHSVASLAAIDPRVRFVAIDAASPDSDAAPTVLLLEAGTVLDRQAVAWFGFVATRTGCAAAYCDHDRSVDDWRAGRMFMQPLFQPVFDPDWFRNPDMAPIALLIDRARLTLSEWRAGSAGQVLRDAASTGTVAHIPLLLASRKRLTSLAERAPADPPGTAFAIVEAGEEAMPGPLVPLSAPGDQRIQVIIQTRDEAAMLKAAIDTLLACAARPALLDITIVDNRSIEPATAGLIEGYRRHGVATALTLDEPFNWSRANNLAAEGGAAPLLLFLNNDTEMLTTGWDDRLRAILSDDAVGIVGAALLYPDRTIQHAGIVMGMGDGGPVHEGVGRQVEDGPNDRWRAPRTASAVTGAFLALRRNVFVDAGAFDAVRFSIAFNDIDLCLRVRATGRRVVMASDIQVIHHESKTRGMNVTRSKVAWDLEELKTFHDRWGAAMFEDPGYNPHWTRVGQPFDGYRIPELREIMRHIDLSARVAPWAPVEPEDEPAWW